jgi:hypothetical protein
MAKTDLLSIFASDLNPHKWRRGWIAQCVSRIVNLSNMQIR